MAHRMNGLIQVYTGDGKGKTTAALGLAWRALGQGLRVAYIGFLKGSHPSGERLWASHMGPDFSCEVFQTAATKMMFTGVAEPADCEATARAWERATQILAVGEHDVVILDEINNALHAGLLSEDAVLDALRRRPSHVEVICTGRGAPDRLIELADLVTEMRAVKHPYQAGISARRGIEY